MIPTDARQLAATIDHTLLVPTATREDIDRLCDEAIQHGFYAVCVNSRWVSAAADRLHGPGIKVAAVVGFPLGAETTQTKTAHAKDAIFEGADEIDMVADLAALVEGDSKYLLGQLRAVVKICRAMRPAVVLKVILETAALTAEQKRFGCRVAQMAGVDFLKTSTGYHPAGGATVEDVALLRAEAPNCKIKASGGIRTAQQALDLLAAGADRIGTSHAVEILRQVRTGLCP
ncbi:MAG: deoxyribose-phosphate aldolase [Phycisphaerae bacterium]|nr:deoxyribose-phosphate aldolase [Phycisphaerae bacterium]